MSLDLLKSLIHIYFFKIILCILFIDILFPYTIAEHKEYLQLFSACRFSFLCEKELDIFLN